MQAVNSEGVATLSSKTEEADECRECRAFPMITVTQRITAPLRAFYLERL